MRVGRHLRAIAIVLEYRLPAIGKSILPPGVFIEGIHARREIRVQRFRDHREHAPHNHIAIQHVFQVVKGVVVVQIRRIRAEIRAHFVLALRELLHIQTAHHRFQLRLARKGDFQIVVDLAIRAARITHLDRMRPEQRVHLRGREILRHRRTGNQRVVIKIAADAVVLAALVVQPVVIGLGVRRVIMEKRIDLIDQSARDAQRGQHDREISRNPELHFLHAVRLLRN